MAMAEASPQIVEFVSESGIVFDRVLPCCSIPFEGFPIFQHLRQVSAIKPLKRCDGMRAIGEIEQKEVKGATPGFWLPESVGFDAVDDIVGCPAFGINVPTVLVP